MPSQDRNQGSIPFPDTDGIVAAAGSEERSRGIKLDGLDVTTMSADHVDEFAVGVPEANDVILMTGGHCGAVGRPREAANSVPRSIRAL